MQYLFLRDAVGIGLSKKEKIAYAIIAGFFSSFYLPVAPVINGLFIGLIALFPFFYNKAGKKFSLLFKRPAILLMILFYGMNIISALISQNRAEGISMLWLRLPLLLFPLALGSIYIGKEFSNRILFLYSFITTIAAIACIVSAFIMYGKTHDTGFLYNDSLTTAINKQSVYFALMVTLAIFFYAYLLWHEALPYRYKPWIFLNIGFLLVIHFLLASRMQITFLYSVAILFITGYFVSRKKIWQAATCIAGLCIACILFVHFFPKTLNRFKELRYSHYEFSSNAVESHYNMQLEPEQWNGANIRLAIWKCGWELSKRHLFTGVPLGDKKEKLKEMYREKNFEFALKTNKNMHSNYLDVLAGFGIFGLAVFLAGFFFLPFRSCLMEKDILGMLIIGAFFLSLITETYIDRNMGCIMLGFFISFTQSRTLSVVANPGIG
jgi:O-antigen ligase